MVPQGAERQVAVKATEGSSTEVRGGLGNTGAV